MDKKARMHEMLIRPEEELDLLRDAHDPSSNQELQSRYLKKLLRISEMKYNARTVVISLRYPVRTDTMTKMRSRLKNLSPDVSIQLQVKENKVCCLAFFP